MREAIKRGLGFGTTSGVITTLGVIIGLNAGTGLRLAVIGGILTVAIADAFSDAMGIHISEETSKRSGRRAVIQAALTTFIAKLIIALTFLIPVIFLPLQKAVLISIIWGVVLLVILNFILAKIKDERPIKTITSHLVLASVVMIITYYVGIIINTYFG